ncbi:MAG: Ig-like domain-containing protein, partial [Methanobrevibacter sp.]|nr:Ig-like domain-containing protein [Methanobrevibacter sp.]
MENINTVSTTAIYKTSAQQPLNSQYTYNTYRIYTKSKSTDGGAIYNTNQTIILNSTFKSITGNIGGAIYNTNDLIMEDTLFDNIQPKSTGSIYNIGTLNINNTQINNNNGMAIYNTGTLNINNTQINKTSTSAIYNNGLLNINNSIMVECSGVGAAIYNTNIANIENCQIINNQGLADTLWRYEEQSNGQVYAFVDRVYSGVIYNGENANANITKSLIKNNILYCTSNGNWATYYGKIKNDGTLKISGCVFDNNNPYWDGRLNQGDGSFNIYNTGKITVMYSYLVNTKIYIGGSTGSGVHSPHSFLYNTGKGTCNINYNFYCLNPDSIIQNANYNYYFIPSFEDDYYPIKLNQTKNITLTLALTNGSDTIEFNDWDKLLTPGLNAIITTINDKGEYINITASLKDYYTFNFNYTSQKAIYPIHANILNYENTAIVDIGKEFANMTVNYTNITYKNGTVTFHINMNGTITMPTGNITITFNNQKTILNLTNGTCNYTVDPKLIPGNYSVKIEYDGDEEYFKIRHNIYKFTIYKIPVNVSLYAPDIRIGETGELTIRVTPSSARMTGYYYLNGKAQDRLNTQNLRTLKLKNFAIGTYNLTVKFTEDEYYTGCEASILFTVKKWQTDITLESEDINAGENATLNLTINPGDVRGEAILEINGVNQTIFINKTTTLITLTNLQNGTYHVTVYYPGDAK